MFKNLNFFEHIICPRFGKRHCLKLFLNLESERGFLQISLTTFSFLFRTAIITIATAPFSGTPLRSYHRATFPTTKKSGKRKIVRYCAIPRMPSHGKLGGRYRYYRCTKKEGKCGQGYLQEAALALQVKKQLQTVSLPEAWADYMLKKVQVFEHDEIHASGNRLGQMKE